MGAAGRQGDRRGSDHGAKSHRFGERRGGGKSHRWGSRSSFCQQMEKAGGVSGFVRQTAMPCLLLTHF